MWCNNPIPIPLHPSLFSRLISVKPHLSLSIQGSQLSTQIVSQFIGLNRKQYKREAFQPQAPSPPSLPLPSPSTCITIQQLWCPEEVNMLKDASPLQECLTLNAFRMVSSLSPRLHKYLYVPAAAFTIHSLGRW